MIEQADTINPTDLSIPELFMERVRRSAQAPAYRYYDRSAQQWVGLSWEQTEHRVSLYRKALSEENLTPGDRVAIMLANGIEWVCFDQAAHSLGLVVVPLFVNDRADNVAYILEQTDSRVFMCPGDRDQLLTAGRG